MIGRMDAVLNSESIASGGPQAGYRVWRRLRQVAVDQLTVPGESLAQITSAARAAGIATDRSDTLVFVDGAVGGACGIATYETDQTLSIDNRSNAGGGLGLVYGPCWVGETAMHESGHLMGAVQYGAPNSTGSGGHCNEDFDVMCYSPDGGDRNQAGTVLRCPGSPRFDCNFDDYFDSAPEPGEYLDSHWNLGSPLNRFIALAGASTPEAVQQAAPPQKLDDGKHGGSAGERGNWRRFEFRVRPRDTTVRVRLFAGPGADLALYARARSAPTKQVYACRDVLRGNHARCVLRDPPPGRWFAGVLTRGGRIGAGYKLRVN